MIRIDVKRVHFVVDRIQWQILWNPVAKKYNHLKCSAEDTGQAAKPFVLYKKVENFSQQLLVEGLEVFNF